MKKKKNKDELTTARGLISSFLVELESPLKPCKWELKTIRFLFEANNIFSIMLQQKHLQIELTL